MLDGEFQYQVSFEEHRMLKHDFVLVDVNEIFALRAVGAAGLICVIGIPLFWLKRYFPYLGPVMLVCDCFSDEPPGFLRPETMDHVKNILGEMIRQAIRGSEIWKDQVLPLFQYFSDYLTVSDYRLDDSQRDFRRGKEEIYSEIFHLIYQNYWKEDCMSLIKSRLNYSPEYLNRIFRAFVGSSIQEAVNNVRCWKSEGDLIFSDESIVDIAFRCGFSDTKYYYKYFKRWYGATPRIFRQKCRENLRYGDSYRRLEGREVCQLDPMLAKKQVLIPVNVLEQNWKILEKLVKNHTAVVLRIEWYLKSVEEWLLFFGRLNGKCRKLWELMEKLECISVITYGREHMETQMVKQVCQEFPRMKIMQTEYIYRDLNCQKSKSVLT